ncbi:hypothetical protein Tco_0713978 [Tanacetum coccineum]
MDNTIAVSPIPTLRIHKDHPKGQILGDPTSAVQTRGKIQKASSAQQALAVSLAFCIIYGFLSIKWKLKELFSKAIIKEEGSPRAWYETLSSFLLENGFRRGRHHVLLSVLVQLYKSAPKASIYLDYSRVAETEIFYRYLKQFNHKLGLGAAVIKGVRKEKSTDKGKRYRRRARSVAKNINTGLDAEEEINSGTTSKRGQREGKALMVEEDIQATHKTKEQIRQEEAKN